MNEQTTPNKPRERHVDEMSSKARTHNKVKRMTPKGFEPAAYTITSGNSGSEYTVQVNADGTTGCNCKYATRGNTLEPWSIPVTCSHTIAVLEHRARYEKRTIKLTTNPNAYQHNKRTIQDGVTIASLPKK